MARPPYRAALLIEALLFLLAKAAPAPAGEVPVSALSHSMRIQPVFLDNEALIFAFPERAASVEPQLFGYNGGEGLGAVARSRSAGLFGLVQSTPMYLPGSANLFQLGWGARASGVSFGAAIRGTYASEQELQEDDRTDVEGYSVDGFSFLKRSVEGSIGLGLERGRLGLDVAIDWRKSAQETGLADQDVVEDARYDSLFRQAENHLDGAWGVSARASVPVGETSNAVLVGGWMRPEHHTRIALLDDDFFAEAREKMRTEIWSAGVAFQTATPVLDRVIFSSMVRVRENLDVASSRYEHTSQLTRYRNWWLAASVEHRILEDWKVRAGIEERYEKLQTDGRYFDSNSLNTETTSRESTGTAFAWGTSYQWKNLRLDGSASTTLDIERLFLVLDAHILF